MLTGDWRSPAQVGNKNGQASVSIQISSLCHFKILSHVIRYATYLNNSKIGCLDEADRNKNCFQDKMFVNTQTSHLKTYLPFSLKIG